jgi:hypothetical protein
METKLEMKKMKKHLVTKFFKIDEDRHGTKIFILSSEESFDEFW